MQNPRKVMELGRALGSALGSGLTNGRFADPHHLWHVKRFVRFEGTSISNGNEPEENPPGHL